MILKLSDVSDKKIGASSTKFLVRRNFFFTPSAMSTKKIKGGAEKKYRVELTYTSKKQF